MNPSDSQFERMKFSAVADPFHEAAHTLIALTQGRRVEAVWAYPLAGGAAYIALHAPETYEEAERQSVLLAGGGVGEELLRELATPETIKVYLATVMRLMEQEQPTREIPKENEPLTVNSFVRHRDGQMAEGTVTVYSDSRKIWVLAEAMARTGQTTMTPHAWHRRAVMIATGILRERWAELEAIAKAILSRGLLDATEIQQILVEAGSNLINPEPSNA